MSIPLLRTALLLLLCAVIVGAEEEKKETPPAPPSVILSVPLALQRGVTNTVALRGLNLAGVTNSTTTAPDVFIEIAEASLSKPPDGLNAAKAGDSRVALVIFLPEAHEGDTLDLLLTSTNGLSTTHPIRVLASSRLILDEREPNGGFRNAQEVALGATVRGAITPKNDVDVFSLRIEQGQAVRFEILSERWGTALDSILTLYNLQGRILATNDDQEGRDSILNFTAPESGNYFIAVQDAHNRGGEAHPYLLEITTE